MKTVTAQHYKSCGNESQGGKLEEESTFKCRRKTDTEAGCGVLRQNVPSTSSGNRESLIANSGQIYYNGNLQGWPI